MLGSADKKVMNRAFEIEISEPQMSVIVITPDHYQTIRCTIQAIQRQTIHNELELIIVCPEKKKLALIESDFKSFFGYRIVAMGGIGSMASGQAAGVRAASSRLVVFTEDHCFPTEKWAESLVRRHREASWAGVGPAVANANPASLISWANFFMEYGEWSEPLPEKPFLHIPGHNSSYKKAILLQYGSDLERQLQSESVMQWDLARAGHTFCVEPEAKTYHLNYSLLLPTLPFRFHAGRLFASRRAAAWSIGRRFFYALMSPLIPTVRMFKILRTVTRVGRMKMIPELFPVLSVLLAIDGIGEFFGYAFGPGNAVRQTVVKDFHRERYVHPFEQARLGDLDSIISLRSEESGERA